jgi:hypothetical protein
MVNKERLFLVITIIDYFFVLLSVTARTTPLLYSDGVKEWWKVMDR